MAALALHTLKRNRHHGALTCVFSATVPNGYSGCDPHSSEGAFWARREHAGAVSPTPRATSTIGVGPRGLVQGLGDHHWGAMQCTSGHEAPGTMRIIPRGNKPCGSVLWEHVDILTNRSNLDVALQFPRDGINVRLHRVDWKVFFAWKTDVTRPVELEYHLPRLHSAGKAVLNSGIEVLIRS
jgi:hypothetical protein